MEINAVVYPGTFDPITNGHVDLIGRTARLFSRVLVAVAENQQKCPLFSHTERLQLTQHVLKPLNNVEVRGFSGLLTTFAIQQGSTVIVRELRAVSDFEYEFQLASMNRYQLPELETLFLTPAEQYTFVSASLIREIARLGGDVSPFVDSCVVAALRRRFAQA